MPAIRGTQTECEFMSAPRCPACSIWVAIWHTHGAYHDDNHDGKDDFNSDHFSKGPFNDTWNSNNLGIDSFLGTPGGRVLLHLKKTGDSEIDYGEL
jgi:hypothetical protein